MGHRRVARLGWCGVATIGHVLQLRDDPHDAATGDRAGSRLDA